MLRSPGVEEQWETPCWHYRPLLKRSGKADGESQWVPAWEVSLRQKQVLGNGGNTTVEDPGTVSIRAMNKSLTAHLLG